jgi:hypothetical protein
MSSLLQGMSGLVFGYATVELPLIMTLVRRKAEVRHLTAAPLLGIPLTIAAGIGNAVVSPLLHGIGVTSGSFLELVAGVGLAAATGYGAARRMVRAPSPTSVHQRGTVVNGAEESAPDRAKPSFFRARGDAGSELSASRAASASVNSNASSGVNAAPEANASPNAPDRRKASVQTHRPLTLAGYPIAPLDETKHFKLVGTTGTGKSTAIRELLGAALERGDRAIIADPDGGYAARFADPSRGDVLLNPFEPESPKWNVFGEIDSPYDVDQLARSLIPDEGNSDRIWTGYARTFFTAVTRQAYEAGITDTSELFRLLVVADAKELQGLLAGTPAQPFLEEHNVKMFGSVRSVTSSAVASLEHVAKQTTGPLSVRQWVRRQASAVTSKESTGESAGQSPGESAGKKSGVLFIPYRATQIAALRSTVSAWMRLAIFEAMSQPEGDQRLWFVVDELDALGAIDGLKDALARLRKFGGRCVLGFQSVAQVSSTYGAGEAHTIVENCGNSLILRCSGSDHGGTANFASRLIGQREVLRTSKSRTRRPTDFMSSTTHSEHIGIEPAVMASEIEQLPDLGGYLKFASVPHWQRVTLAQREGTQADAQARTDARNIWKEWRAAEASAQRQSVQNTPDNVRNTSAGPFAGHDVGHE